MLAQRQPFMSAACAESYGSLRLLRAAPLEDFDIDVNQRDSGGGNAGDAQGLADR